MSGARRDRLDLRQRPVLIAALALAAILAVLVSGGHRAREHAGAPPTRGLALAPGDAIEAARRVTAGLRHGRRSGAFARCQALPRAHTAVGTLGFQSTYSCATFSSDGTARRRSDGRPVRRLWAWDADGAVTRDAPDDQLRDARLDVGAL